ncbi:protein O-mannosyl-transferase family [candidate division KSB1 bacterium]
MNKIKQIFTRDIELSTGALIAFFFSLFIYFRTIAPTVSFWDCGEFIATSYILGVPHPPGSPFFLLLGKLFTMFPFGPNIAYKVNIISVLSSAFTILFLYLIIIQLIRSYKGKITDRNDKFLVYGAALIGSLTYAFTDTFWFSAVEAEVYAFSMLFTSLTLWLALKWFEERQKTDSIRYLLVIVYFIGLAYSVHLLNILLVPTIILLVVFNETKILFSWRLWQVALGTATVFTFFFAVFVGASIDHYISLILLNIVVAGLGGSVIYLYKMLREEFKAEYLFYALFSGAISLFIFFAGDYYAISTLNEKIGGWKLTIIIGFGNLLLSYFLFFGIGLVSGLLMIKYKPDIIVDWRLLGKRIIIATITVMSIVLIAKSTYMTIYIRSNLQPVINENNPSTMDNMLYYLNREQYGTSNMLGTIFDRQAPFIDYQIKFMYLRYFGWNFVGKGEAMNERGFILDNFSLKGLLGLPFLIGLIGFFYHWRKDWKKALSIFVFFILSGLMLVIYLNQPNPQPRERDYVYVGSFFAFAIWIGFGSLNILQNVNKWFAGGSLQKTGTVLAGTALLLICPVNELKTNYDSHDRSGNTVPWDYSYNILESCEKNAILFTNGDNDTFPLWYLQEVEGIRKDIRIVNLSLLNTDWYIYQLKHFEPLVPISLSDEEIDLIEPALWQSQKIGIPVNNAVYENYFREYGREVPENLKDVNRIEVQVDPTMSAGNQTGLRVQDIMIVNIILNNRWNKPIYFAITIPSESLLGFREYMRLDGLAYKVTPVKSPEILKERLYTNLIENFEYKGLNDPDVYLPFGTLRLLYNYKNGFTQLAQVLINTNESGRAIEVLDTMEEKIPSFRLFHDQYLFDVIGRLYYSAGNQDEYIRRIHEMLEWQPPIPRDKQIEYAGYFLSIFRDTLPAEKIFENLWKDNPNDTQTFSSLVLLQERTGKFKDALENMNKWLEAHPGDSNAINKRNELQGKIK